MKKIFYIFCLLLLIKEECFANENRISPMLIEKNGVYYNKKTAKVFTGTIVQKIKEGENLFLLKIPYVKGRIHGEKEMLNATKQKLLSAQYVNALQDGLTRHYYSNGAVKEETYYKKNKKEGTSLFYYEDGVLWWELPYVNGVVEGIGKVYYEKGMLKQSSHFKKGLLDGAMQIYREQGGLWLTFIYKSGNIVQGICYLSNGSRRKITMEEHYMWNLQENIYCP